MNKIDIVLVVLNRKHLERAIKNLNFDAVNLAIIIMDKNSDEKIFSSVEELKNQLNEDLRTMRTYF